MRTYIILSYNCYEFWSIHSHAFFQGFYDGYLPVAYILPNLFLWVSDDFTTPFMLPRKPQMTCLHLYHLFFGFYSSQYMEIIIFIVTSDFYVFISKIPFSDPIILEQWVTLISVYPSLLFAIFSSSFDIFICMWNLELQQSSFNTNNLHIEHDRVEK